MVEVQRGHRYLWAAIALAGINFIMLGVSILLVQQVAALRDDTRETIAATRQQVLNQRLACERGNGLRSAVRFLLKTQEEIAEVVGGAATSAEIRGYFRGIQSQYEPFQALAGVENRNCAADYPLP